MLYSRHKTRRQNTLDRCARMREAKERLRQKLYGPDATPNVCGTVTFEGPAFGGRHAVRLLAAGDATHVLLEVDGRLTCSKTVRGARSLILRRISRLITPTPETHHAQT